MLPGHSAGEVTALWCRSLTLIPGLAKGTGLEPGQQAHLHLGAGLVQIYLSVCWGCLTLRHPGSITWKPCSPSSQVYFLSLYDLWEHLIGQIQRYLLSFTSVLKGGKKRHVSGIRSHSLGAWRLKNHQKVPLVLSALLH